MPLASPFSLRFLRIRILRPIDRSYHDRMTTETPSVPTGVDPTFRRYEQTKRTIRTKRTRVGKEDENVRFLLLLPRFAIRYASENAKYEKEFSFAFPRFLLVLPLSLPFPPPSASAAKDKSLISEYMAHFERRGGSLYSPRRNQFDKNGNSEK